MTIDWGAALAKVANQNDHLWMRFMLDHRDEIYALAELDLRDRWGIRLEAEKLGRIVEYVVQNSDQDEETLIDSLAIEMLSHEIPQVCSGYDEPAGDELLAEIIQTVKGAK